MTVRPDPGAASSERLHTIIASARRDHSTAQDVVLAAVRNAILAGLFGPGSRLRQEELADMFGTSRIPVREALRALEYEGLVVSEPNRGFTVSALDGHDVEEIYGLRILLEAEAVRLAVPLLTDADLDDLQRILDAIRTAGDPDEELASRDRFYLRFYSVAGRPRLIGLIMRLRHEGARVLGWSSSVHSSTVHEKVLDAARRGDAEGVVGLLSEHYQRASALIRRSIREDAVRSRGRAGRRPVAHAQRDGDPR